MKLFLDNKDLLDNFTVLCLFHIFFQMCASGHLLHIYYCTSLALMMKNHATRFYFQCLSRSTAVEIVNSSKVLQAETRTLLDGKILVQLCYFIHVFSLLFA